MTRLPDSARVVVIGGGVAGTSVAYHLARQGWTDMVLVDQPLSHAEVGTTLAVYVDGHAHAVTVASEPRFDPENARLRDVAPAVPVG